jgi:heme-degrading monooxygenase HmoA
VEGKVHARVSSYTLAPGGDPQSAVQAFQNSVDAVRALKGNEGVMLLVNRETETALTITFWDTEENLRSSAEEAARLRKLMATIANVSVDSVGSYEIAFEIRR